MNNRLNDIRNRLDRLFEEGGALARALPGYQARQPQREMAHAVLDTLSSEGVSLLEAGTGTGKSLAYLIPAVLSGRRVVISTRTKALQDQLMDNDIPLVRKILDMPFHAVRLKGRNNYLCKRRFEEFDQSPSFDSRRESALYPHFKKWAEGTRTGDRDEITDLPEDVSFWREVGSTADTCLGRKCPVYRESFTTRARAAAAGADLMIVNHHLFFADLSLKRTGRADLLPDYDAVIFDEAHHIENVCTQFFGTQVSGYRLSELVRDSRAYIASDLPGGLPAEVHALLKDLAAASDRFFNGFLGAETRWMIREGTWKEHHLKDAHALGDLLVRLEGRVSTLTGTTERVVAIGRRCSELRADLEALQRFDDPDTIRWGERHGARGVFLRTSPLNVADILKEQLYDGLKGLVLTSATLSTGGSFDFLRARLGLEECVPVEKSWPAVFDFPRQVLAYLPDDLPDPGQPDFSRSVIERITRLLTASDGRALVLFTSLSMMNAAHKALQDRFDFPVYVQGQMARNELLRRFRDEVRSVLLASATFWEGVDVPGESLSLVVLDRLPFASPGDPIEEARLASLKERGINAFGEYSLPAAILAFRQAFGRLIRTEQDTGVFALLDRRAWSKPYGRRFREALPGCRMTKELAEVEVRFQPVEWTAQAVGGGA